jgi:ankyrin repeat protein
MQTINNNMQTFITLCRDGDLDGLKNKFDKQYVNIHRHNDQGFRESCYGGHINVAKYLINMYKINTNYQIINIHSNKEGSFRWACYYGYFNIVKYLISLCKPHQYKISDYKKINIHSENDHGFTMAEYNKQFKIIKLLISIGSYKINNQIYINIIIL